MLGALFEAGAKPILSKCAAIGAFGSFGARETALTIALKFCVEVGVCRRESTSLCANFFHAGICAAIELVLAHRAFAIFCAALAILFFAISALIRARS